jgi:hypothetical protein
VSWIKRGDKKFLKHAKKFVVIQIIAFILNLVSQACLLSNEVKKINDFGCRWMKFTLVRVESEGMLERDELGRVSLLGCL